MKYLIAITTLFAAGALGTAIPAAPSNGYDLNLKLVTEGKDQYWLLTDDNLPAGLPAAPGPLASRSANQGLQARDSPACSGSHQASTGDCYNLLVALGSDQNGIPQSPRNIRYNNCYVSWSNIPLGGVRAELYSPGVDIYNSCSSNGKVSGLKRNVRVGGSLLTVCLSDRADGCH